MKKKTKYFPKRITASELIEEEVSEQEIKEIANIILSHMGNVKNTYEEYDFIKETRRRKLLELENDLSKKEFENEILKSQIEFLKGQNAYLRDEISEKMNKFHALQKRTVELQTKIVKFQTEVPQTYYLGTAFGIISIVIGGVLNNIIYSIMGLGITITAIFGIWEVKRDAKRGII